MTEETRMVPNPKLNRAQELVLAEWTIDEQRRLCLDGKPAVYLGVVSRGSQHDLKPEDVDMIAQAVVRLPAIFDTLATIAHAEVSSTDEAVQFVEDCKQMARTALEGVVAGMIGAEGPPPA